MVVHVPVLPSWLVRAAVARFARVPVHLGKLNAASVHERRYMASAGTCVICPARDLQVSAIGATSVDECECIAGYYADSGTCKPCPSGTYKTSVGNTGHSSCLACPATQTSAEGSGTCACPHGYHQASGGAPCTPLVECPAGNQLHPSIASQCAGCPKDTYSPNPSTSADACLACPSGTTTGAVANATAASQCQCRPGMVSYSGSAECYRTLPPRRGRWPCNTVFANPFAGAVGGCSAGCCGSCRLWHRCG